MSAVKEIQAAIDRLIEVKAIGWPCDQWTQSAVRHIARNCEIDCHTEDEHECEGWLRYESGPAISLLVRMIDAQLALLSNTVEIRANYVEQGLAANWDRAVERAGDLALARAINGVAS
jgi:hypothetical protein